MLSREEKRQRNAAKNERRIAEEQRAAEEARQKEMEARARQKDIRRREKLEDAEARQEAAEQRLEHKARRRALREAEQKERDEDKRARTAYREAHPGFYYPNLRLHSIIVVALVLLSVYTVLSFLLKEQAGSIGGAIADALLGCFSYTAYLIPVFMLVHAALWRQDVRNRALVPKAICFIPMLLLSSALAAVLAPGFDGAAYDAGAAYLAGNLLTGGGAVGGAIGYVLHNAFGLVGLWLFSIITYLLFGALYFRDLIRLLYAKAHMAIKAALVERAKRREAERASRAEQRATEKAAREEQRLARREEQREEAALRREERRAALREKQAPAVAAPAAEKAKQEAPVLPQAQEREQPRAKRKEEPLPPVRDRILFATNTPAEPRPLPAAMQEQEEGAAPSARARRRALFADLEEESAHTAATYGEADATTEKRARQLFDFDNMPITREHATAPAAKRTSASRRAEPVEEAYADPMRDKTDLDFSSDRLEMTKESVRPIKATEEEAPVAEEAPAKEPALGTSPLGKLLRRSMPATKEPTPAAQEAPAAAGMDYFRRITTSANEQPAADDDRLLDHPDILPMPQRSLPPEEPENEEPSAPVVTEEIEEEEEEPTIVTRVLGARENPFHPQNNPSYSTKAKDPTPRYNGVQDASVFTPSAGMSKPVQQQMQVSAAPATHTPPKPVAPQKPKKPYQYPPVSLLTAPDVVDEGNITAEVQANAEKLVTTLDNFKVRTRVTGYSRGPRITRYEVVPEAGIRVRAISSLVEDISMSLATSGIRIEAPIPGKSAVGIEVPNSTSTLVRLRSMLDSEKFRNFPDKSVVCLGGDVTGQPVYCDLAKMPHMLVAGATGMGKSVCINSIITSILYKATPDEVKLIMIDPKKVEFNIYSGIPHLLVPVVTDPKKAAGALSWAVNEMERRFSLIEQAGVRDIKGYNRHVSEAGEGEALPKIIIIIDELHDLMMSAADAVETSIARIAAKARAAGIHLLIGTQRPSVDVITGTIKANIPSRIAFHVSSQVDSRTILDFTGAEKLLTHGDMLFSPAGAPKPLRVQGAFVDDKEIDRVVEFLKANNEVNEALGEEIMADIEREAEKCVPQKKNSEDELGGGGANIPTDDDDNHLQWAALQVGFEFGKMSTSLLQRKLSIGYGKAAKILDALEDQGYISPPDGSKPREIRITQEEFKEMMARGVQEQTGGNF